MPAKNRAAVRADDKTKAVRYGSISKKESKGYLFEKSIIKRHKKQRDGGSEVF